MCDGVRADALDARYERRLKLESRIEGACVSGKEAGTNLGVACMFE